MHDVMESVYVGIGSNIGDRESNVHEAIRLIDETVGLGVMKSSSLYLSAPVAYEEQPDFINAVILIKSQLGPESLLNQLLGIEKLLGRKRDIRNGPRTIDLDLLLFGELCYEARCEVKERYNCLDGGNKSPKLEISPSSIDFGEASTATKAVSVTVKNTGTCTLNIADAAIDSLDQNRFDCDICDLRSRH